MQTRNLKIDYQYAGNAMLDETILRTEQETMEFVFQPNQIRMVLLERMKE